MTSSLVNIRQAQRTDLDLVLALLQQVELPTEGVAEHLSRFLVAEDMAGAVLGAIGLEYYGGDTALLRSAVVDPSSRSKGVGSALFRSLLESARSLGICRLVLLTNTAEDYFARKGFRQIPRSAITGPITRSIEFTGACPANAVAMELLLSSP